ncbi:hypothetical protein C8F01DRAFT_1141397 [Mycena amicta]|nr:hypothetical protein C8F01DRAFT_1141397 [Mycena amicta]
MMTLHPRITSSTNEVTLEIPPGWSTTVSAVSHRPYHQLMSVVPIGIYALKGNFTSPWGALGVSISDILTKSLAFSIKPHLEPFRVHITFYYSENQGTTSEHLKDDQNASSGVRVIENVKLQSSPNGYSCSIFVKDAKRSYRYEDLSATVFFVKTNPNPIPPPPPPGTQKNYNKILDLPRPSTLENYLKRYDTVFLIDDSGSMEALGKWEELTDALIAISSTAIDYSADSIDIFFLNSERKFVFKDEIKGIQDKSKVAAAISRVTPDGGTPTGWRISQRMREFLARLEDAVDTPSYSEIKPLDLICFTDGASNDEPSMELGKVLVEISALFRAGRHHPNWMGIQFVQIGDDTEATAALARLTQLDTGSIVDTVPYAGPGSLTPAQMERILLGGLHPNIRAQNL